LTHKRTIQDDDKYNWWSKPAHNHHIGFKIEGVVAIVHYDGDMVSTCDGILLECPNDPKFIKISEEMLRVTLRKAVIDAIRVGRSLFEVFYHKLVYVSNGYVEYDGMEL